MTSSQRALQYLNFTGLTYKYLALYCEYEGLASEVALQLGRYRLSRWQLASDIKSEGATALKNPNTSQPLYLSNKVPF